ncbi:peptidase M13 [Pedobacter yulinensis]|uniref:Peptidase M13 n=1 Tax=Pedobacter yulinensis TaxID=2126353 RepID=A0A2T3HQX0_9SPHI|nr:M13 family metallopeptidase [Pedobacter yulinensis]PST84860.1 peptidase M13 [Pedobacter yulinensis]
MNKNLRLLIPVLLAAAACQDRGSGTSGAEVPARTNFLDVAGMDTTVKPGDNFFLYASGNWLKKTAIPKTETGWGSFYTLYNDNLKNLEQILKEAAAARDKPGSAGQKVGDFYASGMDTVTIEKLGYDPIKPLLARIDAIKSPDDLIAFITSGYAEGQGDLLSFYVGPDDKISNKNAVHFGQAGIVLPDRSYYLDQDDKAKKIRQAYKKYVSTLFKLTGSAPAAADQYTDHVIRLETALAASHSTPVELRDPQKNYNKFAVSDIQKRTPGMNWRNVLDRLLIKTDTVLVGQPRYYQTLNTLLRSEPIELWKQKLRFDAINSGAPALSKAFRDARFEFFGRTLSGQQAPTERWKTIVNSTDDNLGELLGQLYTEKHFKPEAKKRMLELVNNLQKVYKARIEKLDWMSADTKKKAIDKLESFLKKIGYPDKWKKYDDVTVGRATYYANLQSARKHAYREMAEKMGKPIDRTEWGMTPPTVNAYYNPSYNEIVFPAGILQFPFFDFNADDAINYGAIGAVIGHEMTHGFDDQGRQYDKDGNLKDWWTPADAAKFKEKADKVVKLYDSFKLYDQQVNGALTLGENLADIGGLNIAYDAFKLTEQGRDNSKRIDGFTPDQRFFLGFAQVWRIKTREETMRVRLKTDPHSPEMFRVNGPVYNMEAFYKAFNVQPTAKMYVKPADRVGVW